MHPLCRVCDHFTKRSLVNWSMEEGLGLDASGAQGQTLHTPSEEERCSDAQQLTPGQTDFSPFFLRRKWTV
jgi:hypothetical protein